MPSVYQTLVFAGLAALASAASQNEEERNTYLVFANILVGLPAIAGGAALVQLAANNADTCCGEDASYSA